MCNFNKQTEDDKAFIALFMQKFAQTIGGANFLLSLIEAMKEKKPNPLMYNGKKISSKNTTIEWNKIVFKDKLDLLEEIITTHKSDEDSDFNILNVQNKKKRKNILNMVKTLSPIDFFVTPNNPEDGGGFEFKVFKEIDFENEIVKLNPIFVAMFFCSTEFTKKALRY
jgi:hypothetical protein